MGIYTSNKYLNTAYDYAAEIPANEAYDAAFGCAHILADCQANDMALFESIIYDDINEVNSYYNEGVSYVNENAFTDVIKKIVEMFKKLLAKIKGIFAAFLVKLTSAFKDGKKLVKDYEKQIIKYSNWDGFKCKKIRKPSSGNDDIRDSIDKLFTNQGTKKMPVNYEITTIFAGMNKDVENIIVDTGLKTLKTERQIDDADTEDIKNEIISAYTNDICNDIKDLHTDIMDKLFDDEDDIDGEDDKISGAWFSAKWIKGILSEEEKWTKDIKKFNKLLEDNINAIINNLKKDDDALAKFMASDTEKSHFYSTSTGYKKTYSTQDNNNKVTKNNNENNFNNYTYKNANKNTKVVWTIEEVQKAIHALQKLAGNEQEVITKVTSEYMTIAKFALAQARKLWSSAAAWSSGVHKESVEYAQAVGECYSEQFYTNMESIR